MRKLPQKLILENIKMTVCGGNHTIAITNTDDVYVWGYNKHEQLGLGDTDDRNSPYQLKFEFGI